jgi:integrase
MLDDPGIERTQLHDARHSSATLMHLRQVPIALISAGLWHASAAFTSSVYAHSHGAASNHGTAASIRRPSGRCVRCQ